VVHEQLRTGRHNTRAWTPQLPLAKKFKTAYKRQEKSDEEVAEVALRSTPKAGTDVAAEEGSVDGGNILRPKRRRIPCPEPLSFPDTVADNAPAPSRARKRPLSEYDEAVINLIKKITPSPQYESCMKEAVRILRGVASKCLNSGEGIRSFCFGSILQSTHFEGSDVDLCIEIPGGDNDDHSYQIQTLRTLCEKVHELSGGRLRIKEQRLAMKIKVPLVVLVFVGGGDGLHVEMDVSVCGFGQVEAGRASSAAKGFTDSIVREILRRRPESIHDSTCQVMGQTSRYQQSTGRLRELVRLDIASAVSFNAA